MTRGTERQDRVYLADCVGEGQAAEAALLLRQAGAEVTRDSRARWFANRRDPRVVAWLAYRANEALAMAEARRLAGL